MKRLETLQKLSDYGLVAVIRATSKEQGIKMSAEVIDFQGTARTVNNNRLTRLTCTAKINGTDYIFKSQPLRLNPVPFLKNGLVDVYYDLGNMKRYFIDVDGSVRDVVEL